jgi:PAS domain S-box-containing protein
MTTHEGIEVFTIFSRSPVSGWGVTISIPKRAVLIYTLQAMAWPSLLVLALPCIGFAWAWYVGKGIRRSVLALASPMDDLGSGGSIATASGASMTFREAGAVALELLRHQQLVEQRTQELALENTERRRTEELLQKQRAQLLQFVANAPVALAMFDRDMRYLEVSDQWSMEYQLDERNVRGRDYYSDNPDLPRRWRIAHQRGLAGEVVRCEEDSFKGDDGLLRWYLWEVRPWRDEQDQIGGILIFFENITARKRIEERLRIVVDEVPSALLIVNHAGLIEMVNARAESFFGYRREELLGQCVDLLVPARFRAQHPQLRAGYLAAPVARPMGSGRDLYALCKDGSELAVEIGLHPLPDGAGMTVLVSVDDITERKRTAELVTAIKAAQASNIIKSAFLASMSHELRTPLNAILGYAQILKDEPNLSERQSMGLHTIMESGQHLLALINDVLDFAKIESGKLALTTDIFDLSYFLKTIRNIIGIKAEGKNLSFTLDLQVDLPQAVQTDETRLRQVLLNLLSNAVKFTDCGQVTLQVTCERSFGDDARLHFAVQDTGIGVSAEQQALLFRPFTQLGEASRQANGTGLGLAISQQLVHLMGGEIGFESQPGVGSRFWFEIPVVVKAKSTEIRGKQAITGYAGARKTILIVDDIAGNRSMLTDFLTNLGFEVAVAVSGQEGLAQLAQSSPDLIIVDMVMLLMSGQEFMRTVRATPGGERLPMIAISATDTKEHQEQFLAAGADTFLSVPFALDALLQEMGSLLPVTWEATQITAEQDASAASLKALPRAQLAKLQALALSGYMHDIVQWAEQLETLAAQYRPFAIKLRRLANDCQSKAILELVEQALRSG